MRCCIFCIMLFFVCCRSHKTFIFSSNDVIEYNHYSWQADSSKLIISNNTKVSLKPVKLLPGKYVIHFKGKGDPAQGINPIINVFFADTFITKVDIQPNSKMYDIKFEIKEGFAGSVEFEFINSYSSETENRNVHLYFPIKLLPY